MTIREQGKLRRILEIAERIASNQPITKVGGVR